MAHLWSKVKKFFKKKERIEIHDYIHNEGQDFATTMSKPDKYKTPAEKGVAVPSAAEDSDHRPYTVPYTGMTSVRNAHGEWVSTYHTSNTGVPSHAAPPLYVVDKKDKKNEETGNIRGVARGERQEAGKEGDKEAQRFHPMYPGVYTRQGPNTKKH
ncbi:hypothetical protein F4805DRAFT_458516 [Annulohypoxylon moriforme]|nr:hypothetical protein F4805DRAFT_458516 [Annulohypoxylon moriforme]